MKLWRWDPKYTPIQLASKVLSACIQKSDLVIGNEQVFSNVLGISPENGIEDLTMRSTNLAKEIIKSFPDLSYVALNMREILSATHNRFGLTFYVKEKDVSYHAPSNMTTYIPYEIDSIVDRVGAGDALAGALLYGMCNLDTFDYKQVAEFAAAAGCLSHSIIGDFNFINKKEIENLLSGSSLGGVVR
jgi:2-dehydro-3-deoxygluconokinase